MTMNNEWIIEALEKDDFVYFGNNVLLRLKSVGGSYSGSGIKSRMDTRRLDRREGEMNIKELAHKAGFNDFPNDENGVWITDGYRDEELKRFAELVSAAEREQCAKHYLGIMRDAVEQAVLKEREACAKVCVEFGQTMNGYGCAAAIRARGDKHNG
jgi:hypothetical protein